MRTCPKCGSTMRFLGFSHFSGSGVYRCKVCFPTTIKSGGGEKMISESRIQKRIREQMIKDNRKLRGGRSGHDIVRAVRMFLGLPVGQQIMVLILLGMSLAPIWLMLALMM